MLLRSSISPPSLALGALGALSDSVYPGNLAPRACLIFYRKYPPPTFVLGALGALGALGRSGVLAFQNPPPPLVLGALGDFGHPGHSS